MCYLYQVLHLLLLFIFINYHCLHVKRIRNRCYENEFSFVFLGSREKLVAITRGCVVRKFHVAILVGKGLQGGKLASKFIID